MKLKASYESQEEIPEALRDYYEEKDGVFRIVEIEGLRPAEEVQTLRRSLENAKKERSEAAEKLKSFEDIDPDKVREMEDELELLRKKAGDDEDSDETLKENVTLRRELNQAQRDLKKAQESLDSVTSERDTAQSELHELKIVEAVDRAADEAKIPTDRRAVLHRFGKDALRIAEDGQIETATDVQDLPAGLNPEQWIEEVVQKEMPYLWPESKGADARGGDGNGGVGNNPFSYEHFSLSEQGRLIRDNPEKAERLAAAAGTKPGVRPPKPE